MTNKEQDRLIAYLVDAGEIDPEGDVAAQFLDWRQVHYQAILEAARIRKRSFDRGYQSGCAAMLGGHPRWPTTRVSATTTRPAAATPKGTLPAWPRRTPNGGLQPVGRQCWEGIAKAWFVLCAHDGNPGIDRHWREWRCVLPAPSMAPTRPTCLPTPPLPPSWVGAPRCGCHSSWASTSWKCAP